MALPRTGATGFAGLPWWPGGHPGGDHIRTVAFLAYHHGVDQDARDLRHQRVHGPHLDQVLDLGDHDASAVVGCGGLQEDSFRPALLIAKDIAVGVSGGGPDDGDVYWYGWVKEVLPSVHLDDLDELLDGPGVEAAARPTRVGKGVEADFGEKAGPARSDRP